MAFYELLKPYTSISIAAFQFLGLSLYTRVITPALACTVAVAMALAVGSGSHFSSILVDGKPIFENSDLLFLFFGFLIAASLVFLIALACDYFFSGVVLGTFLRFILVWTQRRDCSEYEPLKTILPFVESPKTLRRRVNERAKLLREQEKELTSSIDALFEAKKTAIDNFEYFSTVKSVGLVGWAVRFKDLSAAKARLRWIVFHLDRAQAALDRFDEIQNSESKAADGARAFNDSARAMDHISKLIQDLDTLIEKLPLHATNKKPLRQTPTEGSSSAATEKRLPEESKAAAEEDFVKRLADLDRCIQDLRRWRKKLIKSLIVVDELLGHFTRKDIKLIRQSDGFKLWAPQDPDTNKQQKITRRDVLALGDFLRSTTIARRFVSPSSEDYWAEQLAAENPRSILTQQAIDAVAAVDRLRSQAVWYAAINAALLASGPCIVVLGCMLSEQRFWWWVALAAAVQAFSIWPRRWVIGLAVIVAIREGEIGKKIQAKEAAA